MDNRPGKRRRKWVWAAATAVLVCAAACITIAAGPDRNLLLTRDVPISTTAEVIRTSMGLIPEWKGWFHGISSADRVDVMGQVLPLAEQVPVVGALVRLRVAPHPGQLRGSFDLLMKVDRYEAPAGISLSLVRDETGRLDRLFDHLHWSVDLTPEGVLHGVCSAHTRHWRARLLSALAGRILMNQIFYPDLMTLAQFTRPSGPNPYPVYGQ